RQRLATLQQQLDSHASLSANELHDFSILSMKGTQTKDEVALADEFIEGYKASFLGGVEVSSGTRFNFYEIKSDQGKHVKVDPKAVDVYTNWIIEQLDKSYEEEKASGVTIRDQERRTKIATL